MEQITRKCNRFFFDAMLFGIAVFGYSFCIDEPDRTAWRLCYGLGQMAGLNCMRYAILYRRPSGKCVIFGLR